MSVMFGPRTRPPPPSLNTNSASISGRWFCSSQATPLAEPPSSSAVSATMMSRSGTYRSSRIRMITARWIALSSLSSATPRPKNVPSRSMNSNGGRVQSSALASTTSMCDSSRIGFLPVFRPRSRAIRFPFFGAFSSTTTSESGKPKALRRAAIACAAASVLPELSVVLISTSSLKRLRATESHFVCCAWVGVVPIVSKAMATMARFIVGDS